MCGFLLLKNFLKIFEKLFDNALKMCYIMDVAIKKELKIMKFKELFKKIETTNEINKYAGLPQVKVGFTYDYDYTQYFKSYKELAEYIKAEFVLAKEMLESEFEIDKKTTVKAVLFGGYIETTFVVEIYQER